MEKAQLWTRNFVINWVTNFFVFLIYYVLMVIIALYAMNDLQASPSEAGLATGLCLLAGLFSRIFAGRMIVQVGQKNMLYWGLFIYMIAACLYFIADNLHDLYLIRFLHGVGWGICATATGTIVAHLVPHHRQGEGIGYFALSMTLASAVGPFLSIYFMYNFGFKAVLILCASSIFASCIAVLFLKISEPLLSQEEICNLQEVRLDNFFEFGALPIAVIGMMMGIIYASVLGFIATYTKEIGLVEAGSFFYIVYSGYIFLSRPTVGRWFDSKGENFVLYPTFVAFAIGFLLLSKVHSTWVLLLAGVFIGHGFGNFLSSGQALAIKVSPKHRLGLATATFFALLDGGIGLGLFFLGTLLPVTGFRGLYLMMALFSLLTGVLYYFLHGKKARHSGSASPE